MTTTSSRSGSEQSAGGTLFVVSTPIGNLGDVTLRALEVLRSVPLVAAEDTRIAARLFARHEVRARTLSYHAQSGPARREQLLAHLRSGADLALITDAGTPGISDPGDELVRAWAAEDGLVVPIPGASALLAAVVASGLAGPRWVFEGFLPRAGRDRRARIARIAAEDRASVIYEAANRLERTLADLAVACEAERRGAVCRELTKLHEQVVRGRLSELQAAAADGTIPARGEAVIVVGPADELAIAVGEPGAPALASALDAVDALVAGGLGRAEAARRVAAETGIPRRRLYVVAEAR